MSTITDKRMNKSKIVSDSAPEPVGLYPHARRVGNLLFLSGVGPGKKARKEIPASRWTSAARSRRTTSKRNAVACSRT